jgi:hypothetical protein
LCSIAITEPEMAYELHFALRLVLFWFHVACHVTWLDECTKP